MLSFSFARRQKSLDAQRQIRRLVELTDPKDSLQLSARCENRYNRTLPVLVCPIDNGKVDPTKAVIATTKDLSDRGAGIISQSAGNREAIVSFCIDAPWFFMGICHMQSVLGGGFWFNGFELTEFLELGSSSALTDLLPLARELRPSDALQRADSLLQEVLK